MATTAKLQLKCGTMSGEKTFTFSRVNMNAQASAVKTLAQALVTNGSIYKYPPLQVNSATFVITETREVDLS